MPPQTATRLHRKENIMRRTLIILPLTFAVACVLVAASTFAAEVETIALFDPAVPETPESIQIDRHGHIYISLAQTGEVRKIAPDGTQGHSVFVGAIDRE
jgi:sugar lactone lactonase YvrE